jgi:NADPH-dependent curcumin reductase CurA
MPLAEARNREIRLVARPRPAVTEAFFAFGESPVPAPGPGALLIPVGR